MSKKQNKTTMWAAGLIIFLVLAAITAVVARDFLPKTTARTLIIGENCGFSFDRFELDKEQTLKLTVESAKSGLFTIDSYDISEDLTAGEPTDINFKTVRSGAYDMRLSGCEEHTTLLVRDEQGNLPSIDDHHQEEEDSEDEEHGHDEDHAEEEHEE